jgi:predicted RNase H-like HicB family nuclease
MGSPRWGGLSSCSHYPGQARRRACPGHARQHQETGRVSGRETHYAIVIEKAESSFFAYAPDLPGCIATGATVEEVEREIREAIEFHIEGLREDGAHVPQPSSAVGHVETATRLGTARHGAAQRLACDPRFTRDLSPEGTLDNAEILVLAAGVF